MATEKVISLGQFTGNDVGPWIQLGGPDGVINIASCQVSASTGVTAATVNVEYSLDKLGGVPLLTSSLTSSLTSDGTTGVNTRAVYARMKVSGFAGSGFVVGTLVAEV